MKAKLLYKSENVLGEGPIWHMQRNSFFWVDIEQNIIQEYSPDDQRVTVSLMPKKVSALFEHDTNNVVVALQGSIENFNLSTKELTRLFEVEQDIPTNRSNDGKCDSSGRLWLGTMDVDGSMPAGSLYRIDGERRSIRKMVDRLTISNGLAWSLDNQRFYFIDSPTNRVDSYWFNEQSGSITFDRTVIEIPKAIGIPDGMTIDREGMLWIAQWGGYAVNRWNPDTGKMIASITIPAPQVTSCIFGGPDFRQLFITTANKGLSNGSLKDYPLSGNVFVANPGPAGMPGNRFKY